MLSLVKPRFFIPVHGEFRQLSQHARVAKRVFAGRTPKPDILLIENGDLLRFDEHGARVAGKAPVGRVLIDGTRTGEVGDEVLRDRRHLSEDGLVVPVLAINRQTGAIEGVPDIVTRGFVMEDAQALLADGARLLADVMAQSSVEERTDQGVIKEKLRVELRRFLRKRSGRRPLVLPGIMELSRREWIESFPPPPRVRRGRALRGSRHLDYCARQLRAR